MPNTNCLENFKCPKCGHEDSFRITVSTGVIMHDDGSEPDPMNGDNEYDEDSFCGCTACDYEGKIWEFTGGDATKSVSYAQLLQFARQIAGMNYDGDEIEGQEEPFDMENDDTHDTLVNVITMAREFFKP